MAERSSSSASTGKYTKLLKAGSVPGKSSKAKKRRTKQKKEKAAQKGLEVPENVQFDESSLLSTADHTESTLEHKELAQDSGESEEIFSQEMEREPTTEIAQRSDVLEAIASKLEVAEGTSDSKDLKEPMTTDESEEGLAAANSKGPLNEQANEDGEGKVVAADESLGQQTNSKKRMDLLSFGRSKKSKKQRAKSDPPKASGHSDTRKTKSKSLGKENEQEAGGNRDAVEEVDNSPEDAKTVENNEGEIDVSERAQDVTNAAGPANKGKKFKPLAGLRRHKKKANPPKPASAEETNIEENEEVQEEPIQPACDEVFAEENGGKVSEEAEQTEPNEDAKKKSAGKKFGPLLSFRRSKPTKKSTEEGRDDGGEIKEQVEQSQERVEEENQQDPDVLQQDRDAKPSEDLNDECTGIDKESAELVPEEEEIQDECDAADADTEAMATTKKGKKKGLLRRQMKKMWSTNGKNKEEEEKPVLENAEENVADVGSEVQEEEQVKSQNSPAEAGTEESQETGEKVITDREECELADSTVEEKVDEMTLEASPTKSTEKTSLFGRQIKKIKVPIKKKEEKEDEANLTEVSPGVSSADNKEITKQVKRKKSGFQKISNALKKKKSKEEGSQIEDEIVLNLDQGPQEKDPQKVSADVDAEGRSEAEDEKVIQEETKKDDDNEAVKESPRESSEEEELNETVERKDNYQDASAIAKAYKVYGNLMKPVMHELVTKMAKRRGAEPVAEPEDDSELTKSSEFDDHSLTEITSDSSPSFADTYNEDTVNEDPSNSETGKEQKQERKGYQGGKSRDDDQTSMLSTKEVDAVEESSECVPSTPEAERKKNSYGEGETSREELEREVTKSGHLDQSGETSDLSSSQTATSKGRKEEWILVNHLEVSHELSHQLKVFALDSFENSQGCCSLM